MYTDSSWKGYTSATNIYQEKCMLLCSLSALYVDSGAIDIAVRFNLNSLYFDLLSNMIIFINQINNLGNINRTHNE